MTTIEQLREALQGLSVAVSARKKMDIVDPVVTISNLLPTLLDEYEKLERELRELKLNPPGIGDGDVRKAVREAEAGRALAEAVEKDVESFENNYKLHQVRIISPTSAFIAGYVDALSAYHTACGKGEGV